MDIYVVKDCTYKGEIFQLPPPAVEISRISSNGTLIIPDDDPYGEDYSYAKGLWADSLEEALRLAEALRIEALKKVQLEMHRIINLKFRVRP